VGSWDPTTETASSAAFQLVVVGVSVLVDVLVVVMVVSVLVAVVVFMVVVEEVLLATSLAGQEMKFRLKSSTRHRLLKW
jgi:hypothetical protein